MVAEVHRFLSGQDPRSAALSRHIVLQGEGVADLLYHDMFHGVVSVARSLELWALEEWGGDPEAPVITVRLSDIGELDFSGNADPAWASQTFDRLRNPRAPKYGGQRRTRSDGHVQDSAPASGPSLKSSSGWPS